MRDTTNCATGAAYLTAFAILAAALLLVGCGASAGIGQPVDPGGEQPTDPGSEFHDCAQCPVMVVVPAGSYAMGSPPTEAGRHADEAQRTVTIAEPFAVGIYEVTFAEWDACAAAGGCRHRPGDGDWGAAGSRWWT